VITQRDLEAIDGEYWPVKVEPSESKAERVVRIFCMSVCAFIIVYLMGQFLRGWL
jgi:hypothetical protein